ncbi:MAG: DUF3267 domain-containing protein [Candidatus Pacebacteria bacterium]|nr:DUF3267 domain-containing protein [Candidatus Paceibacterota bacterium]
MFTLFQKIFLKLKLYFKLLILSPGIVIHEFSHVVFCLISGVKIHKVRFFRLSERAGYVKHSEPKDFIEAFLISFGPLFLNTLLSFLAFKQFNLNFAEPKNLLFLYLGITIALAAIPSDEDGDSFGKYIKLRFKKNILFFPLFLFYLIIWFLNIANYLKKFGLDYFFTAFVFYLALFY